MNPKKVTVGKTFKDKNIAIKAKVRNNNTKKKTLKFETKDRKYEVKCCDLKIQSLILRRLKFVLYFFILFVSSILLVNGYYWYLRNPYFHSCENNERWVYVNSGDYGCVHIAEVRGFEFKPIIYLYPEDITNVTVALGYPENVTHTYPKYKEPWLVQAEPNGNLTDLKTGRHYYALYWEGKNTVSNHNPTEGFIVSGEDTISFLEEKLDQLGLTEHEAEEFIIYWLPKLESSKYNFIRFQTLIEQNKNMPLEITPVPNTLIRVMMEYRNLEQPIKIKPQVLPSKPQRKGFTVVEWGGTEI